MAVLAVVVFAGTLGGGQQRGDATGAETSVTDVATTTSGAFDVTGMTVPPSTVAPTSSTAVATAKTTLGRSLYSGVFGDDVKQLQTRLTELGFAPGVADGAFGSQTQQAVWAYEKLVLKTPRADATGKVTNEMWQGMQDPIEVAPRRRGSGTHVEIYLPEQVAAVFTDNRATLVIHISSGTAITSARTPENSWCETVTVDTDDKGNKLDPPEQQAVCGVSYTPGGVFRFQRQVSGDRVGALGRMFNPIYFNYGIAMHGAKNVPLEPASHGCIRMHQTISNTFQTYVHLKDLVYVWGQDGKEPESYSKNETLPVFNYPDPTATTTTSTTIPATTTTKPAATTTTAKPAPTTTSVKAAPTTTAAPASTAATTTAPAAPPDTGAG